MSCEYSRFNDVLVLESQVVVLPEYYLFAGLLPDCSGCVGVGL